jgi:hypothetical protein
MNKMFTQTMKITSRETTTTMNKRWKPSTIGTASKLRRTPTITHITYNMNLVKGGEEKPYDYDVPPTPLLPSTTLRTDPDQTLLKNYTAASPTYSLITPPPWKIQRIYLKLSTKRASLPVLLK